MEIKAADSNAEKLGARLKRLRQERKIAASEMARSLGVAATTYREWEKGRGLVAPPFLKMSKVLAISVTELLSGEKPGLDGPIKKLVEIEDLMRELRIELGSIT